MTYLRVSQSHSALEAEVHAGRMMGRRERPGGQGGGLRVCALDLPVLTQPTAVQDR